MEIQQTKHGRGVFATKNYQTGDTIEICQVIVLNHADTVKIDTTKLYNYYFSWGENGKQSALALGNGSLYNHSYKPRARYLKNFDQQTITFTAVTDITKGEEITVNYNGYPNSNEPLWFTVDPA